ncbi:MAG TPA: ABC transporter permease subunit [Rhizomicrobium sp.]|jgi:peptide/nickel transport system permease protein
MTSAAADISDGAGDSRLRTVISAIGLAGVGLTAVVVALSDVIARAPAGAVNVGPPSLAPNAQYAFGTDVLGRDVLSETVHALAVTFSSAVLAAAIAIVAGAVAGFAAVRAPLRLGTILRALSGVLGAVPVLLLAVVIVGLTSHDFAPVAAGLAASPAIFNRSFDRAMRLARSRHAEYARATGIPDLTLLRRDLVYELRGNFLNVSGRALASTAIALATLSFLGFGAGPPHRDLGLVIAAARANYFDVWWSALFPALALTLFILFARLAAVLDEGEPP